MNLKLIIKEPFFHFFLGGVFIFILYNWFNPANTRLDNDTIIIDADDINRLTVQYEKSWNYKPDKPTTEKLIKQEVQNEILYREALRMNLDHNDEIIQRRLKQKFEFLIKDLIDHEVPTQNELKQYYSKNIEKYNTEKTISFYQFYFNPDIRNDPEKDANNYFDKVRKLDLQGQNISADKSHIQSAQNGKTSRQIRQEFGQNFSQNIMQITEVGWQKPMASGYGIHLVYIKELIDSEPIPFEEVKDKVLLDFQNEKSKLYNQNIISELEKKYKIQIDGEWDI